MRKLGTFLIWLSVAMAIIYCAVGTDRSILTHSPTAGLALGLIGLGICMSVRKKIMSSKTAATQAVAFDRN